MFMLPVILAMKLAGFFLSKGIEKVTCMEVSKTDLLNWVSLDTQNRMLLFYSALETGSNIWDIFFFLPLSSFQFIGSILYF